MKSHLFLQGPHGPFFRRLGSQLDRLGDKVIRINFCGGDVVDWFGPQMRLFRGKFTVWSKWIARLMDEEKITDLYVFGDWRPLHREAVLLAKLRGIRVWAFDEGYFRPDYITMEKGGVNGLSTLPKTREELSKLASDCKTSPEAVNVENLLSTRIWRAIAHYAGSALLKLLFHNFQTHRPQSASRELWGYFWRIVSRPKRVKRSIQELNRIYQANVPYFLFPLQLDSDSQVRRYSPFSGMKEAIACVLTSFAESAPAETHIIIRNHPLDNGLINYACFINSFAKACGIEERIHFVENGRPQQMINESLGVVVLNSTMGISALYQGLPVYCVGTSVYAMAGLAVCDKEMPLSDFWATPRRPELEALEDFELVLKSKALINGNFYTNSGVKLAINNAIKILRY